MNYNIYNIEYWYDYYYIITLSTSVCPTVMLFEYMVITLLCGECAMLAYYGWVTVQDSQCNQN